MENKYIKGMVEIVYDQITEGMGIIKWINMVISIVKFIAPDDHLVHELIGIKILHSNIIGKGDPRIIKSVIHSVIQVTTDYAIELFDYTSKKEEEEK